MARVVGLPLLLLSAFSMAASTPASAWTELLTMDAHPRNSGWTGGAGSVNGGILHLIANDFTYFGAPDSWTSMVSPATGFRVEFCMRIVNAPNCYPLTDVGVRIHDNVHLTIITINKNRLYISNPQYSAPYDVSLDATQFHVYTIEGIGTSRRVFVDGELVLDYDHGNNAIGAPGFGFGDLGSHANCGASETEWDYVAYDVAPVVPVAPTTWGKLKTLYRAGP